MNDGHSHRLLRPFVLWLAAASVAGCAGMSRLDYPDVPRGKVVDSYHGTRVADPYRWLETPDSPATRDFVAAQNRLSQPWLEALPQRAWLQRRLTELWNYERFGVPRQAGGRYFFLRNDGRQNQSVLHVAEQADALGRVLVDPNQKRADATIALTRFVPSPDGSVVAYALSDGGSDWETWRFRRVSDGVDLADELVHTKFWELSWARDGRSVYYSRYAPRPAQGAADPRGDDGAQPAVYRHVLGTRQADDARVYAVADHPRRAPSAHVTDDGRWLVVSLFDGYETNGVDLLELTREGARPQRLFADWDALYSVLGNVGETFYVQTTQGAPRGRVVAVDAGDPRRQAWRTIVPEAEAPIAEASLVGGRLIVRYVRDARGEARVFALDGAPVAEVPLPGPGSIAGFGGEFDSPETFFAYTDYLRPTQIWRLETATGRVSLLRAPQLGFDAERYLTEQFFYASRDGTRVPMFVTRRRDQPRSPSTPALLYGYGGFNVSVTPQFRPTTLAWLEMGGIYVEANLRGGGEYGEIWHQAGTRARRQNVFDDFIAAAEYLIREGWTSPARLAIAGRSNGGLLVGATLLQRPELFAAALPAVGVLDMLRYQTASANARQWSSDYGLAEDPADFAALRAYSPVHNVRRGVCYPATLITTGESDDRVVPWHSYKFAAALQRAQACARPVLLRVETRAGHGAGKPVWMQIEDFADQWAFVAAALRLDAAAAAGPDAEAAGTADSQDAAAARRSSR
jgi:prolyl oligopeptidase